MCCSSPDSNLMVDVEIILKEIVLLSDAIRKHLLDSNQ